jgi:hypothetical protein
MDKSGLYGMKTNRDIYLCVVVAWLHIGATAESTLICTYISRRRTTPYRFPLHARNEWVNQAFEKMVEWVVHAMKIVVERLEVMEGVIRTEGVAESLRNAMVENGCIALEIDSNMPWYHEKVYHPKMEAKKALF